MISLLACFTILNFGGVCTIFYILKSHKTGIETLREVETIKHASLMKLADLNVNLVKDVKKLQEALACLTKS